MGRSLPLYALMQTIAMAACWLWFGVLWSVAVVNYSFADPAAWLLLASACAGLFGLRPNLERAIDRVWLQGYTTTPKVVAERLSQLRPIKRRIDIVFSLAVFLAVLLLILSANGVFDLGSGVTG